MRTLSKLVDGLSVPILFLNLFGGIVGGIWILFLGEWQLLLAGLLWLMFGGVSIISLVLSPGTFLQHLASNTSNKNTLFWLGFLSQAYTGLLIILSCWLAFSSSTRFFHAGSSTTLIPYLLWAWDLGLGPWQFLASKEPNNEYTYISLTSASIFYMLFLTSILFLPTLSIFIFLFFCIAQIIFIPAFTTYIASKI